MANPAPRIPVSKTHKLFIGGAFPRSESGRVFPAPTPDGTIVAHCCNASRKDLRDAVRAARAAQPAWQAATPYLRGQILYRAAELLEERRALFQGHLASAGLAPKAAARHVDLSVDRLVHFAGWTDKLAAVFGSVNPVASPHWNLTAPEPVGVVAAFCPDEPSLLSLVTLLAAPLVTGNAVVVLASETEPLSAVAFAEVIAVSDIPAGVVNILTGHRAELAPAAAEHREIQAILDGAASPDTSAILASGAATNLKRVHAWPLAPADWESDEAENPYRILDTVEFKTAWHPSAF
jgi:acyl-CoA reductase-like NAD-dependent aldehyde dehydrogenase